MGLRFGYGQNTPDEAGIALIRAAADLGDGFVPFSPPGKGIPTGAITADTECGATDIRNVVPRFAAENLAANLQLVEQLKEIARSHGATPAQIALAWLLAQKPSICPIPGTTRRQRLEENLGAARVNRTAADGAAISTALAAVSLHGERYPAMHSKLINR